MIQFNMCCIALKVLSNKLTDNTVVNDCSRKHKWDMLATRNQKASST